MIGMSDRTKEIIIKLNIIISCTFGLLVFLIPMLAAILDGGYFEYIQPMPLPQPFYSIWIVDLIAFFVSGIILMILLPLFGLKQKPVKADRIPLPYNSFEEMVEFLQSVLSKNQYQSHELFLLNDQGSMLLFTRKKKLWELNCLAVIRIPELTDELLEQANNKITEFFVGYYGKERITDWISMIALVCVDRITPPFQKFVNSNVQQGLKNYRLPMGMSFGGKTLYIAKQKDGFAITKYKKLRKDFLDMLDISLGE